MSTVKVKKTTESLWNYYRDQPNDFSGNNYDANLITNSEPFKYKPSKQLRFKTSMLRSKTVKTLSKEIQRLGKILKLLFHKTFKQFLEKFRHAFD